MKISTATSLRCILPALLLCALVAHPPHGTAETAPLLPGLHQKHSLTQTRTGLLLLQELACTACHQTGADNGDLGMVGTAKAASDLAEVGWRVAPDHLKTFIASPSTAIPGTTMPDLLAGAPEQRRLEIATAITHFLVDASPRPFKAEPVQARDIEVGRELFHTIGCIVCHPQRDAEGAEAAPNGRLTLAHVAEKYSLASLSAFLFQPANVRPAGRMPDLGLSREEARAVASYLLGPAPSTTKPLEPEDHLVREGRRYYQQFNCQACHALADQAPARASLPLDQLDPTKGCLSSNAAHSPRYHLSPSQVAAVRSALAAPAIALTDHDQLQLSLTAFNCLGCHVRGEDGGIRPELDPFFTSTIPALGDEARLPPPLTLVGAKLQLEWMQKVLFDGERVRPYMNTRMPRLSESHLGFLPALLARVDQMEPVEWPSPDREKAKEWRTAGRALVGDKALNCIACHNFNRKPSPSMQGMDLITTSARLQPTWFYRYLLNPQALRPGIVMPAYWPDGKAVQTEILGGDTEEQIRAIWHYLALGRSAPDPSGIRHAGTQLEVTDAPRLYRGRSRIAGFRGIAVGFPQGLHYAFNAEVGTLTGLWRGEFISVNWSGQAAGNFSPAARPVTLAQDVSLLHRYRPGDPWPLAPQTTKENPVDPDPLYPRRLGYAFQGYYFDDDEVPVLLYRVGDIRVEDRTAPPATSSGETMLRRTLRLETARSRTLHMRPLTGAIEAISDHQFRIPGLRLTLPNAPTLLRPVPGAEASLELIVSFTVPAGTTTFTLDYELAP